MIFVRLPAPVVRVGCDVESVKNRIFTISSFRDAFETHPHSGWCELGTLALMAADKLHTMMV